MNHCLLEVDVLEAPQVRYTQDNQTPVAEMAVQLEGLRPDDPPGQLKVVGWGNLAQDLQNRVQVGQRLMIEGRLRMNTVTRPDGIKEKRAEFTLSRLHPLGAAAGQAGGGPGMPPAASAAPTAMAAAPARPQPRRSPAPATGAPAPAAEPPSWNASPLVPDLPEGDDDIPF
ncbi:single-stranded DNA-binding protein [Cyanobium sp. NIES-981]|uniref:single-stranded DNA-binding protein n=1 Tax=Cyanobium sp. NIES-981 TaxID=1851505 RepID=UPI0007DD75C4|nr:single-stranded DNA-binding protein [Cyanobium sp. NIES-981]SBO42515.1 Single-stranded DNA-binding protein [Cyanobium sp. NIES-981]